MAFLSRYTSTGRLPDAAGVQASVDEAYLAYRGVGRGAVAAVYPALASAPSGLFGICVAASNGALFSAGDVTLFASDPETSDPAMTAGTVCPSPVPAPDEGE